MRPVDYGTSWAELHKTLERMQRELLECACYCAPSDLDPDEHREDCDYRAAMERVTDPDHA